MNKKDFYPFTAGTLIVNKGMLNNIDWGVKYENPLPMFALRHSQGIVLFDTGINHRGLENPSAWWGKSVEGLGISTKVEDCMPWQLKRVGIDPEEVKYVIISHMHLDHVGEMESFPHAAFVVRQSELRFAWWPDKHMRDLYTFPDFKNTRNFDFLELPDLVDFDLFQDQSIVAIHTPGHTPGHQSLIVRLGDVERPMLLCQDACYFRENFSGQMYSSHLIWSSQHWCDTIRRLQYYEDLGFDLWMGHQMDDWEIHLNSLAIES